MRNLIRTVSWTVGLQTISLALFLVTGTAQETGSGQPVPPPKGNWVERLFVSNYTTPPVRTLDTGSDASLDAMIRDGRLYLTAEDAVRLALENNADINVERYNPYFSLWGIVQGRSVLNPSVQVNTNLDRVVTPASSALQGAETLLSLNTLYDVTYHKPFEFGADLDLNFNTLRYRTSSIFNSVNPSFTTNTSFKVTQHLLKDFGRISRGRFVKIAQNNLNISEETFVARTTDIITTVLSTYWDLFFSIEDVKVKEASKKLGEVILDQNKIQAEVGTMSPLDVVQAEADVAAREEQLILSRYARKTSEDQLKKLISSRTDAGVITSTIEPTTPPDSTPPSLVPVTEAVRHAFENRPEVKQLQSDQQNKKIQVDYTKNQLKPSLDLVAGYSMNGLGGTEIIRDYSNGIFNPPIIATIPGGFIDSLDSLTTGKYLGYTAGVTLRVPIGNDDARAASAQAQIDFKQGEEKLRSLRQSIALEVRQAYENIQLARDRIAAGEVTVRYQEKKVQGEQDKYALGATTTRFVLEAQRDLEDAQSRLLLAKLLLVRGKIALDKALGDTFVAHNIVLDKALRLVK